MASNLKKRLGIFAERSFWLLIGTLTFIIWIWLNGAWALGIPNWLIRCIAMYMILFGYPCIFAYILKLAVKRSAMDQALKDHI